MRLSRQGVRVSAAWSTYRGGYVLVTCSRSASSPAGTARPWAAPSSMAAPSWHNANVLGGSDERGVGVPAIEASPPALRTSVDAIFARVLGASASHRAAARARANAPPPPSVADENGSWDASGRHDTHGADSELAGTPKPPPRTTFAARSARAGTSRANPSAWMGLRRLSWKSLSVSPASASAAGPWRPSAPPHPPPPSAVSPQALRHAELYNRAYAHWESNNARILRALHESSRLQEAAKQTIAASRRKNFLAYEQQTVRWTMWYVFPMMLIAHTAFFTDAALFGETLDAIAYVEYDERPGHGKRP